MKLKYFILFILSLIIIQKQILTLPKKVNSTEEININFNIYKKSILQNPKNEILINKSIKIAIKCIKSENEILQVDGMSFLFFLIKTNSIYITKEQKEEIKKISKKYLLSKNIFLREIATNINLILGELKFDASILKV